MREIGKDNTTEEEQEKIIELLQQEDQSNLKFDISLAPEWIRKLMKQAVNDLILPDT